MATAKAINGKVLEVKNLQTYFHTSEGVVKAVDGLPYHVNRGECVGLVGESACGRSVSAMSVLRLIPYPPGAIEGGEIIFKGEDLLQATEHRMREIRGNRIAMIFQEPTTSLNPVLTVGRQLTEGLELHQGLDKKAALSEGPRLLKLVGIPDAEQRIKEHPFPFSGGMQQRIMIAMALSCEPELIIADEPTTSLDVTVQAQILAILASLRAVFHTAVMIITHNLGLVARYVDRVNVMYAGNLVETGPTEVIYADPKHLYTLGLLASVPRLDRPAKENLRVIEGLPPDPARLPKGCSFAPRCDYAMDRCREEKPALERVGKNHFRTCLIDPNKLKKLTSGITRTMERSHFVDVEELVMYFPVTAVVFRRKVADVKAVDNISFFINKGETLGLVGESGCGKTTTGSCILQLNQVTSGSIHFKGENLVGMKGQALRKMRRHMQLIFQDPFASLDPRMTAGDIIGEPLLVHDIAHGKEYKEQVTELLNMVELQPYMADRYPHEFSGGQRQRIGIARALAAKPAFIVCGEHWGACHLI